MNGSKDGVGARCSTALLRAPLPPMPDAAATVFFKINTQGSLIYADPAGRELLISLGWRNGNALPQPLVEFAQRVSGTRQSLLAEIEWGDLAYAFTVTASQAAHHVSFFGKPVRGVPPSLVAVLTTLPNLIWAADPSGTVTYLNQRGLDYTGLSLRQLRQLGWERICHPEDAPRFIALLATAKESSSWFEAEFRYRRHDGRYRWFLTRTLPIKDGRGNVTQWVSTSVDIEARKCAELELHQAQTALQSATARLEQIVAERTRGLVRSLEEARSFAYSAAHDLNAPLRAIESQVQAVLEDCQTVLGPRSEYLRVAINLAQQMRSFSNALLELGKLDHSELNLIPLDLAELLRQVVAHQPQFQPPLARVTLPESPVLVYGEPTLLRQCASNLLGNAVKFVPPNTVPRVQVHAKANGTHIRISFKDYGIGIAPEDLGSIFMPFRKVAGTDYSGHGLGLALVHRAVTRMRGRVGVHSKSGRGSCFWIELLKPTSRMTVNRATRAPAETVHRS